MKIKSIRAVRAAVLSAIVLLSSCASVPQPTIHHSDHHQTNSNSEMIKNAAKVKELFDNKMISSNAIRTIMNSSIKPDFSKISTERSQGTVSALLPTNKENYFLFIADIDDNETDIQLLYIKDRDSDKITLVTTYLDTGHIIETTSDLKTNNVVSSRIGRYESTESISSLSTIKTGLSALSINYACKSAQQALVSANMTLAAAVIGYTTALASCVFFTPFFCAMGLASANTLLGAAGAAVNSAKYTIAASCR